jgi:DNA invertase Pin-like site-specific DNA recombinase
VNLVALYARVSKDICRTCGKAEASHNETLNHEFKGQDPEAQLQPLREMCRLKEWTIAHEYVDQGWSGASESRPAFDELMAAIDATDPKKPATRKFDGVLVWKFDRFFRSTSHMLQVLDKFNAKRIEFISQTEQIDTSSPVGRLVFTLLAAIAEFERSLIAERIRNGMKKQGAKKPGPKIGPNGPSSTTLWRRGKACQNQPR